MRHDRRSKEENHGDADRHGAAEMPGQEEPDGRDVVDERAERGVEVAVGHLAGRDPMGAVEKDEQVVDVSGRDGAARPGEQSSRGRGHAQDHEEGMSPRARKAGCGAPSHFSAPAGDGPSSVRFRVPARNARR